MNEYYKYFAFAILSISVASCYDKYSRKKHKRTTEIEKGLFVETYTVYGSGALGTDMVSQYLTDSLNFRKYIGTIDEGIEFYYYRSHEDTVYIEKYKSGINNEGKKLLLREQYSLADLQKTNNLR